MFKDLLIFGAGGHAVKVARIALEQKYNILGYISTEVQNTVIDESKKVLGYIDYYRSNEKLKSVNTHIGIGENSIRYKIYNEIGMLHKNITTITSNSCIIAPTAILGQGCFIAQGAIIQNNVKIGKCCIVDTGAVVDHDTSVGDFVTISPNSTICSKVKIGNGAIIGAGSVIIEKVNIGDNTLIGAGSVVISNVPANVVVVGNPARIIRKREFNETYFK